MPKQSFASFYREAQQLQRDGQAAAFPDLIERARKAGLTEDDLTILGALFEGAFQFAKPDGSR